MIATAGFSMFDQDTMRCAEIAEESRKICRRKDIVSEFLMTKVKAILHQIVREWSQQG